LVLELIAELAAPSFNQTVVIAQDFKDCVTVDPLGCDPFAHQSRGDPVDDDPGLIAAEIRRLLSQHFDRKSG
jgi:hypothetical protein